MSEQRIRVHPTAIVEDGATIGDRTQIWHHAHVRDGSTLGQDCVLGKNVYIDTGAIVGRRVKIQNNVSVYLGVEIGDDVFVGPAVTFTNDLVPRAFNTDWQVTPTHVADGASIGANSTIVCGNTLGSFCMVAAGATVTRDVDDHQLVGGTPSRHLGWVCRCGTLLTRDQTKPSRLTCDQCEDCAS